jgi:hypothetical protein
VSCPPLLGVPGGAAWWNQHTLEDSNPRRGLLLFHDNQEPLHSTYDNASTRQYSGDTVVARCRAGLAHRAITVSGLQSCNFKKYGMYWILRTTDRTMDSPSIVQ